MKVSEGDVVRVRLFGGEEKKLKVEGVHEDVKNGRPGIDGVCVDDPNDFRWCYLSQIIEVVEKGKS